MEERLQRYKQQMDALRTYMTTGCYGPDTVSPSAKRNIRNSARTHILKDGSLMYVGDKKRGPRQVVTEVEAVADILKQHHTTPLGEHSGQNATLGKISRNYWWSGMGTDVQEFVSSCENCQRHQKSQKTHIAPILPSFKEVKVAEPLEVVGISLIGPLPMTANGNQYVLSMTDYFTKFVELFALPEKDPCRISKCIKTFITRWGAPKRILSDQGSKFCNKVNRELCFSLHINHSVISAYTCNQMNKLDEPTNHTVKTMISTFSGENEERWDEILDDVVFSLRTRKDTSKTYSPFYQMFGRHPRMPVEIEEAEDEVDIISVIREEKKACVQSRQRETSNNLKRIEEAEDGVDIIPVIGEEERESCVQSRQNETSNNLKRKNNMFKASRHVKAKKASIEKHCVCQQPNDGRKYWCCTICDGWFHPSCVGMKEKKKPKGNFYCPDCS